MIQETLSDKSQHFCRIKMFNTLGIEGNIIKAIYENPMANMLYDQRLKALPSDNPEQGMLN